MVFWVSGSPSGQAESQVPLHDSQYSDADIAYGATLYASKCVTCHGPQGDGIGGVNLRSGKFRNAVTDRELELVRLIVRGLANKQIAGEMGISIKTVANHRANLMAKTGALNAADLVRMSMIAEIV